ncbi:alpha/beta hydrolase [Sphingopyxis lindanitolerans]|uniref:Alpha/beta hydrolase n=1 Tax=Sphingopyxis lindanitolerans TaxID=2054227 RepID=A0A2S8B9W3_9SPHN|nr:alpha/beta hydrolase [Sphingopyxis lindanitolerans]PQM29103.1 alpha/beta hydrolase [Sphingopyxis lindanitolerans]
MTIRQGIAVRDTILWVEDTGEPNLAPIVCLHSLFLDGRMFDDLVPAAAGRFRVVRPDFRGQGGSAPATEATVSMECCAEDMIALIEAMALPPVHLAAASMGGDVAVRMLARRPELFRSVVMMGSSVRSEPPEQMANFRGLLDRTIEDGFVGDDLEMMMAIMFGATTRAKPEAQAMLAHWCSRIGFLTRSSWPAMYGVLERGDAANLLPLVTVPALVYSSEDDIARPIEWSREVADGIRGARLVPLQGVGHSPILEASAVVIPEMLAFMAAADQERKA